MYLKTKVVSVSEWHSIGVFQSSRVLRQGDPFSPYLFVLAMEVLSCLLRRAKEGGYLSGFKVLSRNEEGLELSQLLFVDNTLVFCEASSNQMTYLSWLLMWFETILGLKINLAKNELILVGRVLNVEELTFEVGCKVGALLTTYWGLPLRATHNSVVVWEEVEERFRKRLTMWKRQYISKRGRLTLVKSMLASLPIYFMSLL